MTIVPPPFPCSYEEMAEYDKKLSERSRREDERRVQEFANAAANYGKLPEAMSTDKCPKCLYGEFDAHQGLETSFVQRAWTGKNWTKHPSQARHHEPVADLLERSCPRCKHEFFERTADAPGVINGGQWWRTHG